jgi:hypothetical protein
MATSVPNIPGFYLVFRAWSHYRALYGARHLEFLVKQNLVEHKPSTLLDRIYTAGLIKSTTGKPVAADEVTCEQIKSMVTRTQRQLESGMPEVMLLSPDSGKDIAEAYQVRELAMEVERAYEQVDKALREQATRQADEVDREKR